MTHFFETGIAEMYGIESAILLHYIHYWVLHNRANDTNYRDGRYWTYNSRAAFKKLFPYMSEWRIKESLSQLQKGGMILIGCYNEKAFDRTSWYTTTDECDRLYESIDSIGRNTTHRIVEIQPMEEVEHTPPIPYRYTNNKVLSNESTSLSYNQQSMFSDIEDTKDIQSNKDKESTNTKKISSKQDKISLKNKIIHLIDEYTSDEELRTSLREFVAMREKQRKPIPSEHAMELLLKSLTNLCGNDMKKKKTTVDKATMKCWLSFYPLKQEDIMMMEERQTDLDYIF